ncbi:MAG: hypothetical protein WEA10_02055 [Actinomycetota bacterium]
MNARWYELRTSQTIKLQPEDPSAACTPDQPFGCPPKLKDVVLQVLMAPKHYQWETEPSA